MPLAPTNKPGYFGDILGLECLRKIFYKIIAISTQSATVLQTSCKFELNSNIIFTSIRGPDVTFERDVSA